MINPLKFAEMLSKANEVQEEVQRKLGETILEASSGGGAVTATMNGKKQLLKLKIDPSAVVSLGGNQPDVEMLEDLGASTFPASANGIAHSCLRETHCRIAKCVPSMCFNG